MNAETATVPAHSWSQFLADDFRWEQGEHLTLIGPTKSGKTTLARQILSLKKWVVAFATKRRDPVLRELAGDGFQRFGEWVDVDADIAPRRVIAPQVRGRADTIQSQRDRQREVFGEALNRAFRQGGWTLYLDELRYLTDYLGLAREVEMLWQQGRSEGVTVIGGVQRPRHVPLLAYDQATHLFLFHNGDRSALDRLGEIGGGIEADRVRGAVAALDFHEVLYVNTVPPGRMVRTKVEV